MTTTEVTTCDRCRRTLDCERHYEITIRGPYTVADDPNDKHLCGRCWDTVRAEFPNGDTQ